MSVTVLAKNTCTTTGEGPFWDETTNSLLYVDILAGDVHCWSTISGEDTKVHLDGTTVADESVSFIIPRTKGGYVIGLGRSLSLLDWDAGSAQKVVEVESRGTKNRFNDAKCDASGRLWAGTMGHEVTPAVPEKEMGSLYSLGQDHMVKEHVGKLDISNGLAWSHDNKIMYFIDSCPRKVYAFDFDIEAGTLSNQRTAIDFGEGTLETLGYPDGMCIDLDGKLWIACYSAGKVVQFDPETAKQLYEVKFPAKRITSCCFGGVNFSELYVTCGVTGLSDEEFRSQQPLAGSVFKVSGLPARGAAAPMFIG